MIIKKDTILKISHNRKGRFFGMATREFDSKKEEFYPIVVAQLAPVYGITDKWKTGEEIPCKKDLCKIKLVEELK